MTTNLILIWILIQEPPSYYRREGANLISDNQIIQQLITVIRNGLDKIDQADQKEEVVVLQSYQPTITGVSSKPAILLHKINTHRYGWPHRKDVYNPETGLFEHSETMIMESTIQIDALVNTDPESSHPETSSDLLQRVASIFEQCYTWNILRRANIGFYRITSIRDLFFLDDRDRHQQMSSFDITLTYPQTTMDVVHPVSRHKVHVTRA